MIYGLECLIPKNTAKTNPSEFTLTISKGLVTEVVVYFPWGCAGLVGLQILYHGTQAWPTSMNEWLTGNDFTHVLKDSLDCTVKPYQLVIRGYNEDDTFEHKPFLHLQLTEKAQSPRLQAFLRSLGMG